MKVKFNIGSKERLLEMMGNVNTDFKPHAENHIIKSITTPVNENEPEVDSNDHDQEDVSQANIVASNKLEAQANATAIPTEQDNEKPIIDSKDEKTVFTITVAEHNKNVANKNIESMKKMARKLSLPEPIVTFGNKRQELFSSSRNDGEGGAIINKYMVDVFDVTVDTSKLFRLGGEYDLVAVVDNTTGGSIETDPEKKVPTEYLQPSSECDLCHQERYRGKCFVVTDVHGDYKRLGSSCVKKYIGIDPSKFIKAIAFISSFQDTMGELGAGEDSYDSGGGRGSWSLGNLLTDYNKVVSIIYDIIQRDGFEKKLWDDGDNVGYRNIKPERSNYGNATSEKSNKILLDDSQVENYPVNGQLVEEFTEFLNNLPIDPKNSEGLIEFYTNLKDMPNKNVRIKDVGILAAGVNMFLKNKAKIAKNAEIKDSQWIGEIGTKIKIPHLRLVDVRSGEGEYGVWYLWSFIDDNGNSFKKFGKLSEKFKIESAPEGSENLSGYKRGDVFAFTAEVKKHDTYDNIKSTMLGRLSKL